MTEINTPSTIPELLGAHESARIDLTADRPSLSVPGDAISPEVAVQIGAKLGGILAYEGGVASSAVADDQGTVRTIFESDGRPKEVKYFPRLEADRPD